MEPTLILHAALIVCLLTIGVFRQIVRNSAASAMSAHAAQAASSERRKALQARLWVVACLDHLSFAITRHSDSGLSHAAQRLAPAIAALMDNTPDGNANRALQDWMSVRLDSLVSDIDRFNIAVGGLNDDAARTALASSVHDFADACEARVGLDVARVGQPLLDQIASLKTDLPRRGAHLRP